jgi:hypothetical protein
MTVRPPADQQGKKATMSVRPARARRLATAVLPVMAGVTIAAASLMLPAAQAAQTAPLEPGLHQTARISLGTTTSFFKNTFTEAPDGTIFYSKGSVVYVVDGNSAPAVALHASGQVMALAASKADLFVQVGLVVTEFTRSNGARVRAWTLTSPVKPITTAGLLVSGTTLWSWTDWATDFSGFEYARVSRIITTSATVHTVDSLADPGDMAADSSGLYYQDFRGTAMTAGLAHDTPAGSVHTRPQANIDAPAGLSGGRLYLLSVHSSNAHQYIDGYSTASLARLSSAQVSGDDRNIAGTSVGLIVLTESCPHLNCASATVSKLSAGGSVSGTVTVPDAATLLPGPSAAVIEDVAGHMFLVRIGA